MQSLRLPILALGIFLLVACGSSGPSHPVPIHIRQSIRHLNLAAEYFTKGCYQQALVHYQQAHERYTASDQTAGIAHSLNGIANVYYRLGELPGAIKVYDEAIAIYKVAKARSEQVRAMCNQAAALIADGRLDEAETLLDQADHLAANDVIKPALRQKSRAILIMKRKAAKTAAALLEEAIDAAEAREPEQLSSANYTLGLLLLDQRQPSKALPYLNRSLRLDRAKGAYDDIAHDLEALGACYGQLAQNQQAIAHYQRSMKIFALLGNANKVQAIANLLKTHPTESNRSVLSALQWAAQWLAGQKEANLCR